MNAHTRCSPDVNQFFSQKRHSGCIGKDMETLPSGTITKMFNAKTDKQGNSKRAERDLIALGIAVAAIIMFVGTGSSVLPQIARNWIGVGEGPDTILVNALLLNIALIIFGWRRYNELIAEIAERKKAEESARLLAETDPLTGCLNRRSIKSAADALIAQQLPQERAVALLMIDLDNFKLVNDLNGHSVGDSVLLQTAERLNAVLPENGLLARLGGDEFACVLPFETHHPDIVESHIARIFETMAVPMNFDSHSAEVSMSIGIASTENDIGQADRTQSISTLMHQADIAMYHAKKRGKNRHFWFDPSMEKELRFRNDLEAGIRRALSRQEFVPYYEQQIDLETGSLTGFEMLARWDSPELGSIPPTIFIPIAEEMGVIAELSEMLLKQAFEDAKEWHSDLTLSVNISPLQLDDSWFAQRLLKLLVAHNFPAQRLEIEVTESCLHENIGMVRNMITSLKNQGVKVSLDDFGTGYSSLGQLRSLPFDRIKIDRSFIRELGDDESGVKIVDAIVSLGEGLNIPITAEGIEDERILANLKKLGKFKGQGYHYGMPEPHSHVKARLATMGLLADRRPDDESSENFDGEQGSRGSHREAN